MGESITVMTLGTTAAIASTIAFVPQIRKTWKTGGKDLSYFMLSLYVTGVTLWLCYGLAIGAKALALANAASIGFAGTCLVLKLLKERNASASRDRKRLRIAIDMDETIADSLKEQIRRYNDQFAESVTEADLAGRHLHEFAPPERSEAVQRMVHDPEFFDRLDVIKDAQQVIGELAREHEVLIVSSAMEVPESFASKHRWLRRNFPFIAPSNVIFCGNKGAIRADCLIDDEARHFANFRGTGLLFSAPHNAGELRFERITSWEQVRRKFRDLEEVGARARMNTRMRVHAPVPRASDVGGPMVPTFPTRENG